MTGLGRLFRATTAASLIYATTTAAESQKHLGLDDKTAASANPFTDDFAGFAKETLEDWKVPGVAIAVIDDDEIYAEGYGFASFPDTPATPETIWYGASTSKAQLAAVLSHLIDTKAHAGLSAGWTTPVSALIRDDFVLQDDWATAHITLDDAVSHRTGMPRHDLSSPRELAGRPATPRDVVRNLRNLALTYPPRVAFHYCNMMFVMLSHVVETLTGRWLGDVLRETLWAPLGMNSTYFDLDEALAAPAHFAAGYSWDASEGKYHEVPKMGVTEVSGAGGVMSTALDYAKWVHCLLHEAAPLSEAVHKDIKTPRMMASTAPAAGLDVQLYSLAWQRVTFRGHVVYTHSGGMHAYGAEVYWLPEHKYGVVAFGNTAVTSNAAEEVLGWRLIQDKLGIPRDEQYDFGASWRTRLEAAKKSSKKALDDLYPDRPEPPLPPTVNTSMHVGTYYNAGYGSITLREEPDPKSSGETVLIADRPEMSWRYRLTLQHVSADYYVVAVTQLRDIADSFLNDYAMGWFVIGADGEVAGLNIGWENTNGTQTMGVSWFSKVG